MIANHGMQKNTKWKSNGNVAEEFAVAAKIDPSTTGASTLPIAAVEALIPLIAPIVPDSAALLTKMLTDANAVAPNPALNVITITMSAHNS